MVLDVAVAVGATVEAVAEAVGTEMPMAETRDCDGDERVELAPVGVVGACQGRFVPTVAAVGVGASVEVGMAVAPPPLAGGTVGCDGR